MDIGKWTRFAKEYLEFRRQEKRWGGVFRFGKLYPCLDDRSKDIEARGHYFHQDLLVAQKIFLNNPVKHVDVGSRMDGLVAHVASFREIEVVDIRPLNADIRNVKFTQADVTRDDFELTDYCDSLSSLHAVEHFGLGRYGDVIDNIGYLKGLEALYNTLKVGGKFYVSFPIGSQRVEFNAHRVFSVEFLLDLFEKHYILDSFSYVDDDGNLVKNQSLGSGFAGEYGCGIFELTKVKTDVPFVGHWRIGMSHGDKRSRGGRKQLLGKGVPLLLKLFPKNPLESGYSTTRSERKLVRELKDAVATFETGEKDHVGLEKDWQGKLERLRQLVLNGNLREFLRWDVIRETMFVDNEPYIDIEFQHLRQSLFWNKYWRKAIEEIAVGQPTPYRGWPQSSGNLIHHAYHICRFHEETGVDLDALEVVFEFGGGYGSMCRLFYNLKFKGKYIIFDLPDFAALQRYYLQMVGVPVYTPDSFESVEYGVICVSELEQLNSLFPVGGRADQAKSLFIATWSLSEVPLKLRQNIMSRATHFNALLMAYQKTYAGFDNLEYFEELKNLNADVSWSTREIEHLSGNYYLFGNRLEKKND